MLVIVLAAIAATALAGLAVKHILEFKNSDARITWREFAIGMAISPILAGLVAWAGWSIAKQNKTTFTEYWNGWEVAAVTVPIVCSKDGPCRWEYNCEPYLVSYECNCTTDDKGHTSCSTCYRTEYHDCPYVTQETNYKVNTTLGSYTIASNVFPDNPQMHRWKNTRDYQSSIPGHVVSQAGTGPPPFWTAVRTRCDANRPGPVTVQRDYQNYILASEHTLMKEYSSDIADYQARKLLPSLTTNIHSFYHASKVYFVGSTPSNHQDWQEALAYLNANIGYKMQGDLHLVVVRDDTIAKNPDRYSLALKAYWQDKNTFGNTTLSKNAIVVLVGTTGTDIFTSWSRAFTGMPLGNEKLLVVMRDGLKGLPMISGDLIGPRVSRRDTKGVYYPPNNEYGPIQRVLLGISDPATKFKRVSMSGDDGQGGFLYLKNEIQPSRGQTWVILIFTFLLSCGVWVWAGMHFDPSENGYRWRRG